MAITCVPREQAEKLKEGIKNGDIDIAKFLEMTSTSRREVFSKYVPEEMAKFINKNFEKAMLSSRKQAMADWVKKTFVDKKLESSKKDILNKIDKIEDLMNEGHQLNTVEDFVSESLGVKVSDQEVGRLIEYSKKLKESRINIDEWGNPGTEYFKERRELINYLNSINPSSNADVAFGTIGRGAMLFSLKSPLLNIESNTLFGGLGALERRLMGFRFRGLNNKEVLKFIKHNTAQYAKTETDLIIMDNMEADYKVRGENIVSSQGPGKIAKIGRLTESYAFKYPQGVPDIFSESFHFADFLNIETTKIAYHEGLTGQKAQQRSLELMKDAINITPKDPIAIDLRQKARAEALYYTYKNNSLYSEIGLGARELMNKLGSAFGFNKLGESVAPFVKTPANVIGAGIELSGGAGIKGVMEIVRAYKNRSLVDVKKAHLRNGIRLLIRQGLGTVITAGLASLIDDSDYMPDYLSASNEEKAFARQYKVPFNAIKIGSKWVSFDYFGPLGAPLKAFIHARKYSETPLDASFSYLLAVGRQILTFPGLQNLNEFIDNTWKKFRAKEPKEAFKETGVEILDFVSSRFTPAILSDMAKGIDEYERQTKILGGLGAPIAKIPLLRELLPEQQNIFGEKLKTEPFLSNIIAGARIRTAKEGIIYNELERLLEQGELPSINDIQRSSSRVKLMQEKLGKDKFNELLIYFGENFKKELEKEVDRYSYKKLSDEEKKDKINAIKNDVLEKTLQKYHYDRIKRREEREKK